MQGAFALHNLTLFSGGSRYRSGIQVACQCSLFAYVQKLGEVVGSSGMFYVFWQDYVFEADEQRLRKAAHLMVTCLAGSLALVGSRESMRSLLALQLRNVLTENIPGIEDQVRQM